MTMTLKTQYDTPDGSIDGGIQTWVADVERVETVRWVRLATWQHFYDAFVGMAGQQVHAYLESSVDVDVDTDGTDDAARLGVAFREMLGTLARSREDQQRLVQDAGHELRTPLSIVLDDVAQSMRSPAATTPRPIRSLASP